MADKPSKSQEPVSESNPSLLVQALAEAGCEARTYAMATLADEVSKRTGLSESQPLTTAAAKVLGSLNKKAAKHNEKFKDLVCNYLLKVPRASFGEHLTLKPCELIEPLATLDMEADGEADGRADRDGEGEGEGDEEDLSKRDGAEGDQDLDHSRNMSDSHGNASGEAPKGKSRSPSDSELASVFHAVGEAICQGQQLQEEALTLQKRLDLLRSMVELLRGSSESKTSGDASTTVAISKKLTTLMQMLGSQRHDAEPDQGAADYGKSHGTASLKRASPTKQMQDFGSQKAGSFATPESMEVEPKGSPKRFRSHFDGAGAARPQQTYHQPHHQPYRSLQNPQHEPAGFGLLRREPQQQPPPTSSGFLFQGDQEAAAFDGGRQYFRSQAAFR